MAQFTYQERFRTFRGVFDAFTDRNLFELHSHRVFEDLVSPLEVGKESNVFIASKGNKKLIVKIYRVQNCDFKRMYNYIRKDPRYEFLKNHRREIIFAWVQREYKNLLKAHQAGVTVPKPLACKFNILVEEMIGDEKPAPQLKDALPLHPHQFLDEVIAQMQKLYAAKLIHGDLSAFNILNDQEKPVLIDFSQSTVLKTPNSEELLVRDVTNIIHFFKKLGIAVNFEETFLKITGKEYVKD